MLARDNFLGDLGVVTSCCRALEDEDGGVDDDDEACCCNCSFNASLWMSSKEMA